MKNKNQLYISLLNDKYTENIKKLKKVQDKLLGKKVLKIQGSIGNDNYLYSKKQLDKKIKNQSYKYLIFFFKTTLGRNFSINFKFIINGSKILKISFSNFYNYDKTIKENFVNLKIKNCGKWTFLIFNCEKFFKNFFENKFQIDSYHVLEFNINPNLFIKEIFLSDCSFENQNFPKDLNLFVKSKNEKDFNFIIKDSIITDNDIEFEKLKENKVLNNLEKVKIETKKKKLKSKKTIDKKEKDIKSKKNIKLDKKKKSFKSKKNIKLKKEKKLEEEDNEDNEEPQILQINKNQIKQIPLKIENKTNILKIKKQKNENLKYLNPNPIFETLYINHIDIKNKKIEFYNKENIFLISNKNLVLYNFYNKNCKFFPVEKNNILDYLFFKKKNILFILENTLQPTLYIYSILPKFLLKKVKLENFQKGEKMSISYSINSPQKMRLIFNLTQNEKTYLAYYEYNTKTKILVFLAKIYSNLIVKKLSFLDKTRPCSMIILHNNEIQLLNYKNNELVKNFINFQKYDIERLTDFQILSICDTNKNLKNHYIYISTRNGFIFNYDFTNKNIINKIKITNNEINCLELDKINNYLLIGEKNGNIYFYSLDLNEKINEFNLEKSSKIIKTSKKIDEYLILLTNNTLGILNNVKNSFNLIKKTHLNKIISICYNNFMKYLITIGNDSKIFIYDTNYFNCNIYEFECKDSTPISACSFNKSFYYISGFVNGFIRIFDIKNFLFIKEIKISEFPIVKIQVFFDDKGIILVDSEFTVFFLNEDYEIFSEIKSIYEFDNNNLDFFQIGIDLTNNFFFYSLDCYKLQIYDFKLKEKKNIIRHLNKIKICNFGFVNNFIIILDEKNILTFYKKNKNGKFWINKEIRQLNLEDTVFFKPSLNNKYIFTLSKNGIFKIWDFYFRGSIVPEFLMYDNTEDFNEFLLTEDLSNKIFLFNKNIGKIETILFLGENSLGFDKTYLDEEFIKNEIEIKENEKKIEKKNDKKDLTSINNSVIIKTDNSEKEISLKKYQNSKKELKMEIEKEIKQAHLKIYEKNQKIENNIKIKSNTEIITGITLTENYSSQIIIDKKTNKILYKWKNYIIGLNLEKSKKKSIYDLSNNKRGYDLLLTSENKEKYIFIRSENLKNMGIEIKIYNSNFLKQEENIFCFDDFLKIKDCLLILQNDILVVLGISDKNQNFSLVKFINIKSEEIICETVIKEKMEKIKVTKRKKNEIEFLSISKKNIYFFKLKKKELLYQKLNFDNFKYIQIDYTFNTIETFLINKNIYGIIGTEKGSIIIIDINSGSIITNFLYFINKKINDIKISYENKEIILFNDSEMLIILNDLNFDNLNLFLQSLKNCKKDLMNFDGKIISSNFEKNNNNLVLLTNNFSLYYVDIKNRNYVKIFNYHSKKIINYKNIEADKNLITCSNNHCIKFYNSINYEEKFEFIFPNEICLFIEKIPNFEAYIMCFENGKMRIFKNNNYFGNINLNLKSDIQFLKFFKKYPKNFLFFSEKNIFIGIINEGFKIQTKLLQKYNFIIKNLDINFFNNQEFITISLKNGNIITYNLTDILKNIELPYNYINDYNVLNIDTTKLFILDNYFINFKDKKKIYYPFSIFCKFDKNIILIYEKNSNFFVFRNFKDHNNIQKIDTFIEIQKILFLKHFNSICILGKNGILKFFSYFEEKFVFEYDTEIEEVLDIIEIKDRDIGKFKKLFCKFLLLTENGIIKIELNDN